MVLKDAYWWLGRKMRDARERQAEGRIKRNEKWGTKDMEHQDLLCNIIDQHIKFHPSDDFTDNFNTTHPNRHWLTMTHTVLSSTPLLIESSHRIKSSFHFYPNFPMMSHCVSFYYSFSFWFIIWFVMLFWKELSGIFLWLIDEQSLTDLWNVCLVVLDSPHVYKEAVLPHGKDNQVRLYS